MNAQNKKVIKETAKQFVTRATEIMQDERTKTPARKKKLMLDMWNDGINRAIKLTKDIRLISYYGVVTNKISLLLDAEEFYKLVVGWSELLGSGKNIWN